MGIDEQERERIDFADALSSTESDEDVRTLASILGRRGGRARARRLSPERRSAISREAARSRWHPTD
jgi:hypothetical protein